MTKRFLLFVLFCFCVCQSNPIHAQDSSRIRISLLTCTPGEELYSTFGHSALRVTDSNSVTDHVYNYGTFDFDEPGFYVKFIRGKLRYYVSIQNFEDFKADYIFENRGMTEQVLNLTAEEKINIRHALIENLKPENKFYMYDFFLDNCTTRLRDIILKYHQPRLQLPAVMPVDYTFRDAIHQYLDSNHKDWSKFGIDILLGAPTDAVMTTDQQQFLPDNLMLALDGSRNDAIISSKKDLYLITSQRNRQSFFTPTVFFISLFLFFVVLAIFRSRNVKRILHGLDAFLFFATGLLGIVLVLMWVATDHTMTKNNYNLLWAWPMHFIYAFFINKESKKVRFYSLFTAIFLFLLLFAWYFLKQQMNNALLPLILLLIWRSSSKAFRIKRDTVQPIKQEQYVG